MGDNDYLCHVNLSYTVLVVNNQFPSDLFYTPAFSQVLLKYRLYMYSYLNPELKTLLTIKLTAEQRLGL